VNPRDRAVMALLVLIVACGGDRSSADSSIAAPASPSGAYAFLATDAFEADKYWDGLVHCEEDLPCSQAGFLPGIMFAASVRDHERGYGIMILFRGDVTEPQIARLVDRATSSGVTDFELLAAEDTWPYCVGESECFTVERSAAG
jgi:hypothetical protein